MGENKEQDKSFTMEFRLNTFNIHELMLVVCDKLKELGVTNKASLLIYVTKEQLKKIDEDLFYRNRKSDDEEFIPSEGEIYVNFDNLTVIIREEGYKEEGS